MLNQRNSWKRKIPKTKWEIYLIMIISFKEACNTKRSTKHLLKTRMAKLQMVVHSNQQF